MTIHFSPALKAPVVDVDGLEFDICQERNGACVRRVDDVVNAVANGSAIAITDMAWHGFTDGWCRVNPLPGVASDWEIVAIYHVDLSGYCELEGKFEYHYDTRYLMMRRIVEPVDADVWEDRAEALGF